MNSFARCLALFCLLSAPVTWAQSVYVIDHLAVGLHAERDVASAIVKVLPTGSTLEVLQREENFLKVRSSDGTEGWVDITFVMEQKPAQLALLELEASYVDTRNELEVARSENESLNLKIESLQSAQTGQVPSEGVNSDTLRELQRLAEENQLLLSDLEEMKIALKTAEDHQPAAESIISSPAVSTLSVPGGGGGFLGLGKWHWIMVVALMVLSFGLGGYAVDWGIRRRHGGFRI